MSIFNKFKKQSNKSTAYKIKGMDCASCASLIECELEDKGIKGKVSYTKETLEVDTHSKKDLALIIKKLGYSLEES